MKDELPIARFDNEERDDPDARALEDLLKLLPIEHLERAIVAYFNSTAVRRRMPGPRHLRQLIKQFRSAGILLESTAYEQVLGSPPPELIREETRVAARVLLDHWLSGLGEARRLWSTKHELPLTERLWPDWESSSAPEPRVRRSWETHTEEALDVALRSLAVTREDVGVIANAFGDNAFGALRASQHLRLPNRFAIILPGDRPMLVTADSSRQ